MKGFSFIAIGLLLCAFMAPAFGQGYASGHGPLEIWDEAARENVPLWIRVWLRLLFLIFAIGLFFVRTRMEARWAVASFVGVFAGATLSQAWTDLVPLAGFIALLHVVFWTPLLILLLIRRPFLKETSLFGLWSGALTLAIAFSLIFDVRDTTIYLDHVLDLGVVS